MLAIQFIMSIITEKMNKKISALFYCDVNVEAKPIVCIVCDQFTGLDYCYIKTKRLEKYKGNFQPKTPDVKPAIKACYQYKEKGG